MRHITLTLLALVLLGAALAGRVQSEEKTNVMNIKKITPVLYVDEVEPCVKFWVDRLGFKIAAEVPDGNKVGFAMLQKGNAEVMYQSYASALKDVASVGQEAPKGRSFLYIEVENLDDFISATKGAEVFAPVRTTFYGAKEIGVRDPAGHFIMFAQFTAAAAQP